MSVDITPAIEYSDPFIDGLLSHFGEPVQEGLTTAKVMGELAIPTLVTDPDEVAIQLVVITGGAAGGKSTLANDMAAELRTQDIDSAVIRTDDFVLWDRQERHRREQAGMRPEAKYAFYEMRRAIGAICANQDPDRTVAVPQYDSHTGLAVDGALRRHIPKVGVLIVEGDMLGEHGVTPQDLYPSNASNPRTLYVHVSDEERLRRRVVRDMAERNGYGASAHSIVDSFMHRQATQHRPYTLQYAPTADAILKPASDNASYGIQTYDMHVRT